MKHPTLADIRAAAARIEGHAHRTPVMHSRRLDEAVGAEIYLKCENLQRVGAFKFRGACNTVLSLSEREAQRGVATHSSGNHGAALALAAQVRGVPAHIVMPKTSVAVKKAAVAGYGAEIVECEPTQAARESTLEEVVARTGATFVHPYDDPRVVAGQGTAALELLDEVSDLDVVMTPVGGGGLLSGTSIAVGELAPNVRVVAGEPAGADDAYRSLRAGERVPQVSANTIADGLLTSLGELNWAIIKERVHDIVTVDDAATVAAMRFVWERLKIIIEPSSAVPLAVLFARKVEGKRIGVILSGGNVDLDALPWAS